MIQRVTVYTVICDRCGKDHSDGTEFIGWSCPDGAENIAIESGWEKRENDEHICEDCQIEELNYICRDDLID
jgi:peptide subunit release factor 1 (eRF1)